MGNLVIGQKVAYPNQGVCVVESHKSCVSGAVTISGFSLRVLSDNSTIFVPDSNTDNIGIRPLISTSECRKLLDRLEGDFDRISLDWKVRSKDFIDKIRSGDLFEVADVLKKLTYLSHRKKLSFREQSLMEKARFLIVSELSNAKIAIGSHIDSLVDQLVQTACANHYEPEVEPNVAVLPDDASITI